MTMAEKKEAERLRYEDIEDCAVEKVNSQNYGRRVRRKWKLGCSWLGEKLLW